MLTVARAPAYATVQDAGRPGFMSSGVPRAGAMDIPSLFTLNTMLGNDRSCAAIELALSGGEIEFESSAAFAVGGATADLRLSGRVIPMWQVHQAIQGDSLAIAPPRDGRFIYLAVAGGIDVPLIMRSRSTYLPGQFGGLDGRRLKNGDILGVIETGRKQRHQVSDALPADLRPHQRINTVRYIPRGGHELAGEFVISGASDRTGYRLDSVTRLAGDSILSEPVCPGTIQVPPEGHPIVLMADAPTIGGYRIAGAVISADLGCLAQRSPRDTIAFESVTVYEAQKILERVSGKLESVREWRLA
ncbi:MAG: biotin-dependent carboxyltransferase family protein [Gemmatimonadota bacterium]|nr:biotin-dependent carboxyltransferase family protein [Gemmatimonadota bacterium]